MGGKNCFIIHYLGRPVDRFDQLCKNYKDCQKCAKRLYGENCVGEITKYSWEYLIGPRISEVSCSDPENTCERATCECDRIFALQLEQRNRSKNNHFK